QATQGLVGIFENEFYVPTRNYIFQLDATSWGWTHLILGVLVAFAGWGLFSGRTWARTVAIILAVLSAIANFLFIPYYPFWSLLIITLDVFVIWAVAAHGGDLREPAWARGHPLPVSGNLEAGAAGWSEPQVAVVALDDGSASRCPPPGPS